MGLVVFGSIAAVLLYAGAVIGAKNARQQRRLAVASDDGARVRAIWTSATESLAPLGVHHGTTETITEFTRRAAKADPEVRRPLEGLGELASAATYGGADAIGESAVTDATSHQQRLNEVLDAKVDLTTKLRHRLDPRPLLRRRP